MKDRHARSSLLAVCSDHPLSTDRPKSECNRNIRNIHHKTNAAQRCIGLVSTMRDNSIWHTTIGTRGQYGAGRHQEANVANAWETRDKRGEHETPLRNTMKPSTDGSTALAVKRADVGSKERIRGSTRSHAHCSRRLATPQGRARARRASAERLHRGFGYPVTPGKQPAQQRRRGRACWGETRRWFAPARCRERVWRHAILRSGAYRNGKSANAE